jgi:predicted kinase
MKIFNLKLHTIILLVGPYQCGKSTFAKILSEKIKNQFKNISDDYNANIQVISSDQTRYNLLGDTKFNKYHNKNMDDVSTMAFNLLFQQLKYVTSFPINAEFVILDTSGMSEIFRKQVFEIADNNNYNVDVVLFDYKNRNDYIKYNRICKDNELFNSLSRFKRDVLPIINKKIVLDNGTKCHFSNKFIVDNINNITNESIIINIENYENYFKNLLTQEKNYFIIGDLHESMKALVDLIETSDKFTIIDEIIFLRDNKYIDNEIIFIGDLLDKGNNTENTINFFYKNLKYRENNETHMPKLKFILGNHENTVYNIINGLRILKDNEYEFYNTHFSSLLYLYNNKEAIEKFNYIYSHMNRFFVINNDNINNKYYLTHSPCNIKYLGKIDNLSLREQMYFYLDRDNRHKVYDYLEQNKKDLDRYNVKHIFGHLSFDQVLHDGNLVGIDTGAVYGNKLTGIFVGKNYKYIKYISVDCKYVNKTTELIKLYDKKLKEREIKTVVNIMDSLDEYEKRIINKMIKNKINYISGTISPPKSNIITNSLESIDDAIEYYKNFKEVIGLSIQPKYMGSRCQIYLYNIKDVDNLEKCYAVSRNGFVIKKVNLSNIYNKLYDNVFVKLENIYNCKLKLIIFDGELLPWSILGQDLIDKTFNTIKYGVESELKELDESGFSDIYNELINKYNNNEKIDDGTLKELKYNNYLTKGYDIEKYKSYYKNYKKQIDNYGNNKGNIEYKPFNLLKIVDTNDNEIIIDDKNPQKIFEMICDNNDLHCTFDTNIFKSNGYNIYIDLSDNFDNQMKNLKLFYTHITNNHTKIINNKIINIDALEGVVVKPIINDTNHMRCAPMMKVRNPNYLSIIYGYDYLDTDRYKKLIRQKNIDKKVKKSLYEYNLGNNLLKIKYSDLNKNNNEYINLLCKLIFNDNNTNIDPRL